MRDSKAGPPAKVSSSFSNSTSITTLLSEMSLAKTISLQSVVVEPSLKLYSSVCVVLRVKLAYKTSIESVLRADFATLLLLNDSRLKVTEVPEDALEPSITTPVLSVTEV